MKIKKTNCGIYQIKNIKDNRYYLGSSSNLKSRKNQHYSLLNLGKHSNNFIQNSVNKHGIKSFKWEIIKYLGKIEDKELLKEELLKWEQYYIDDYKSKGIELYNIRKKAISNLGVKFSIEHKKKLSEARKGKKDSKETIERKRLAGTKRKHTKESKEKLSLAHKGLKHTEESKQKMSISHKGKKLSQESIDKRTESRGNYTPSQETIRKMSESKYKRVTNLTTDEVFSSLKEASKIYKTSSQAIGNACRGVCKTSCGCRWEFSEYNKRISYEERNRSKKN